MELKTREAAVNVKNPKKNGSELRLKKDKVQISNLTFASKGCCAVTVNSLLSSTHLS